VPEEEAGQVAVSRARPGSMFMY